VKALKVAEKRVERTEKHSFDGLGVMMADLLVPTVVQLVVVMDYWRVDMKDFFEVEYSELSMVV
jgi:hypothetical protein